MTAHLGYYFALSTYIYKKIGIFPYILAVAVESFMEKLIASDAGVLIFFFFKGRIWQQKRGGVQGYLL